MQPSTRIAKALKEPTQTRITHGTVEEVQGDKVSVLVDNAAAPEVLNRACVCSAGDRVIIVGSDAVATIGATGGGGSGGLLEYSFITEQVKVIDSQSVSSGGKYLATLAVQKAGYYPVGVVGWTSSNEYPNVYACRLSSQTMGEAEITCGASNLSGSSRTFNVWVTVLWVAQTSLSDANGEDF